MSELSNEPFLDQLMRAIVKQFFENPPIIPDGNGGWLPPRSTPVQVVAARMLAEKNGELLDTIMEKLDVNVLAEDIAKNTAEILLAPNSVGIYNRDPNDARRNDLKKRVDERLVELMAQDMFTKMQEKTDD